MIYPYFLFGFSISILLYYIYVDKNVFSNLNLYVVDFTMLFAALHGPYTYSLLVTMWYFSALLISILFLFPLIKKYKEYYFAIIAPVISMFGYGYFSIKYGNMSQWSEAYGVLRACAGVSLGNIVYYLSMKKIKYTLLGKKVIKILEFVVCISVLCLMNIYYFDYNDFLETILFAILIYLAFTLEHSKIFDLKIMNVLGEYSAVLYVVHYALAWIPKSVWGDCWKAEYLLWMLMTNIVSFVVWIFVKYVFLNVIHKMKTLMIKNV